MRHGYYLGASLLAILNWQIIKGECPGTQTSRSKSKCVLLSNDLASSECDIPTGGKGFCCDDVIGNKRGAPLSNRQSRPTTAARLQHPDVDEDTIEAAINAIPGVCKTCQRKTGGHNFFTKPKKSNDDIMNSAQKLLYAGGSIGVRDDDVTGLNSANSGAVKRHCIWENSRKPNCRKVPKSSDGKREYRTIDGSCNNLRNPLFGLAGTPVQRLIEPAEYTPNTKKNTKDNPRKATDGGELPSARLVSNTVFTDGVQTDGDFTHLLMQIGQFLDHDLTHVPAVTGNEDGKNCCDGADGRVFPPFIKDESRCFPIEVPKVDPIWGKFGSRGEDRTCMEFARAVFAPTLDCRTGKREQRNEITHWMDMSQVYGSSEEELEHLRNSKEPHRLLETTTSTSQRTLSRPLLPRCLTQSRAEIRLLDNEARESIEICETCQRGGNINNCFFAGDERINEQPALATMHTIWVREHNRIADVLLTLRPRDRKEDIFQETRRIVIAEWQHIVFQEWLPIIIGKNYMTEFEMLPLSSGYSTRYNPGPDPRINNEFAVAAFRFGHTLVFDEVPQRDFNKRNLDGEDLDETFDDASLLNEPNFVDQTARGMVGQAMPKFDANFADDILHKLFENDLDLTALNIQRSRDHGVPGYNRYRGLCESTQNGFRAVRSIADLARDGRISRDAVSRLKKIYRDVDDIDLFVGGILEFFGPHDDALLGPTFLCIIGDQFRRLKEGDRFWFENGEDESTRFTNLQLDAIRKTSMARILCDNTEIGKTQPLAFRQQKRGNDVVVCTDRKTIPSLDLTAFVE